MKIKGMKRPTLPTANLGLLERLYRWGVVWAVLFVIFFAVHSNQNYLFRLASSLCFVGMVVLLVTIINKVLIEYLLKKNRLVFFILLSIFAIPFWSLASISIDACLLHFIAGEPFVEIFDISRFIVSYLVRLVWFIAVYALVVIFYYQRKEYEEIRKGIALTELEVSNIDREAEQIARYNLGNGKIPASQLGAEIAKIANELTKKKKDEKAGNQYQLFRIAFKLSITKVYFTVSYLHLLCFSFRHNACGLYQVL